VCLFLDIDPAAMIHHHFFAQLEISMLKKCASLFAGIVLISSLAIGQGSQHWVSTWATSPQVRAVPAQQPANAPPAGFNNQTIRMIVRTTIGGPRARVQFSNAFGTTAVTIGAARIALRARESTVVEGTNRVLSFGGKPSFTIPPGALVVSDPVDLNIPPFSDVAVSVYFPGDTGPQTTMHNLALQTTYVSRQGDHTAAASIADATTSPSWYWLSNVDILSPAATAAVVTFGDSITDGRNSTTGANRSWPSVLAQRLAANPSTANIAVLNHGIAGNRLLRDNVGANALARFDRDVLAQPGVKWVTVLEGINDIGRGVGPNAPPADAVTAEDVIGAYRQLIERARSRGIRIIGGTLLPYGGAATFNEAGEVIRVAVNQWIRTSGAFDAVVDFDAATRDPANPSRLRAEFDSGDRLHPNDAGYKAMADAVSLSIFEK
jgi:lysophospholipase L1-like esterase